MPFLSKKLRFTLLAALLTAFLGYNLVVQIQNTLKSSDKLETATKDLTDLEAKNRGLKEKLSEVKSPQYIEKEARDKLGLAREGETIVVIPNDKLQAILGVKKATEEAKIPNWLGWWRLFSN